MSAANDDAESVDQFLARIASLKDRRDREDEERTRKLEEDILQGRKDRQARRAERARSLSPSKNASPAPSLSSTVDVKPMAIRPIEPPIEFSPRSQTQTPTRSPVMDGPLSQHFAQDSPNTQPSRVLPTPPLKSSSTTIPTPPTATLPRSGTLSWQQRPTSRDSNSSRPRPLSGSPLPSRFSKPADAPEAEAVEELSRIQIAESLGSKDPSWFRQTSDRGVGSAAYRRNEIEHGSEYSTARTMRLPGMSQDREVEPIKPPALDASFSRAGTPLLGIKKASLMDAKEQIFKAPSRSTSPGLVTPPLPKPQVLGTSSKGAEEASRPSELNQPLTASQGFGSSSRPSSPTKGLGGFVQSAMMKRSDSVNKRWSVQAAPGLKRGDSVAGNRGALGAIPHSVSPAGPSGSPPRLTRPLQRPTSSSPANSRPGSSYGANAYVPTSASLDEPETTHQSRFTSVENETSGLSAKAGDAPQEPQTSYFGGNDTSKEPLLDHALPVSPTKTIEPRRWSPTKSSWLESALTRPESPKISSTKSDTPTWKADLQKSKIARADSEVASSQAANFEVKTASLLRSPPTVGHSRPFSIGGLAESVTSALGKNSVEQSKKTSVGEDLEEGPFAEDTASTMADAKPPEEKLERSAESHPDKLNVNQKLMPTPSTSASTMKRDPPTVKAKPETTAKIDFRANLKPRQVGNVEDSDKEPEFKAVFGKLKRTQTRNYVAPDELKANITQGKAALNLTSGPQKTKRVDEFKESILQKKEAMKSDVGPGRKKISIEKPPPLVPEALAKRQVLGKARGNSDILDAPTSSLASTMPSQKSREIDSQENGVRVAKSSPDPASALVSKEIPSATAKPMMKSPNDPVDENVLPTPIAWKQETATSKLAARLNPGLAGFLSRGNSPKPANRSEASEEVSQGLIVSTRAMASKADSESGGPLTHMTKARAKGPKRRAPKAEALADAKVAEPQMTLPRAQSETLLAKTVGESSANLSEKSPPLNIAANFTKPLSPMPLASILKAQTGTGRTKPDTADLPSSEPGVVPKIRPNVVAKSPELRKVSSPLPKATVSEPPTSPGKDKMRAFDIAQDRSKKFPAKPTKTNDSLTASPVAAAPSPLAPSTTRLNSSKSASSSSPSPEKPLVIKTTKSLGGLGLSLAPSPKKEGSATVSELTPPPHRSMSTQGAARLIVKDDTADIKTNLRGGQLSTVQSCIEEFFDRRPKSQDKASFDTQAIMTAGAETNGKIKTLNMQIWEITGDGKKQNMPPQQEHILFEECMYLCVHSFENGSPSKSVEAYLWIGDAVGEAAMEDVQLFCRKIARENSAKLEVFKQGKETANFFQALGGIVITRRSKSSSLYMLCGRRHLGHIAFDEVDMELINICSGFPYIVSAKFGKLFLWKGRGSAADELGCARLIGMDLGLTGEIEEINEGEEPAAFFECFPSKISRQPSDLWALKSTQEAYACHLYRVEHERPKSATGFWGRRGSSPGKSSNKALIEEVSPYHQSDLDPHHIYLLDSYFEIYVLMGAKTPPKSSEFVTALMLAQEMSILAPSLQDRPLMPVCHVVFGDPPQDFKATFRKWTDDGRAGATLTKALPLHEVMDALA